MRILIVDDDEAILSMMKIVFESDGYTVVAAASAAEAIGLLSADSFEAVITDMKMESENAGYDVVREARALPNPPVIIILTAYPLLTKDWRDAGVDAVASKPSRMPQLLKTVAELLRQHRRRSTRLA